jgi:hypothetical protein
MSNQTLQIDDDHNHARPVDGIPPDYHIYATTSLELDATGYRFKLSVDGRPPNCIQLILSGEQMFWMPWVEGQNRQLISRDSLMPLNRSRPFEGFPAGGNCVISIGHMEIDEVERTLQLQVLWAGMVLVGALQ